MNGLRDCRLIENECSNKGQCTGHESTTKSFGVKYRKKPVVVEAVLLTDESCRKVAEWSGGTPDAIGRGIKLQTLEGPVFVQNGYYVIKGIEGEFYPCRADIFMQTYEVAV